MSTETSNHAMQTDAMSARLRQLTPTRAADRERIIIQPSFRT